MEQNETVTVTPPTKRRAARKPSVMSRRDFYERTYIAWIAQQGVMAMANLRPFCTNLPKAYEAYVALMEDAGDGSGE